MNLNDILGKLGNIRVVGCNARYVRPAATRKHRRGLLCELRLDVLAGVLAGVLPRHLLGCPGREWISRFGVFAVDQVRAVVGACRLCGARLHRRLLLHLLTIGSDRSDP